MPPKIATPLPQGPTALEKVEEEMILGANKDSSHKKYASVLRAFEDFCHRFAASQGIQLKYDRALFAVYIKQLAKSNTLVSCWRCIVPSSSSSWNRKHTMLTQ